MKSRIVFSRQSDEWATPDTLFLVLDSEFGFELDCAASAENAKCEHWLGPGGLAEDALTVPWCGVNWLNPPYSRVREFVQKAHDEMCRGNTTVLLLPSRTDTRWWHQFVWDRTVHRPYRDVEVRFIKGWLKFGGATAGAPFPSVIVVMRGVE